jgi:3-oxoacyl-[acyl-carrier protein] reductase
VVFIFLVPQPIHKVQAEMPVAVITGSSSGIGKATAIRFAQAGYSVILHARSNLCGLADATAEVRHAFVDPNQDVRCITADISHPLACRDLVQAAFYGEGVDVWVNNAGADVLTGSHRLKNFEEKLQLLLQVDVMGTARISRLVAERMNTVAERMNAAVAAQTSNDGYASGEMPRPCRRPAIVNLSWDQANLGMEGDSGQLFCTAKSAVSAFTTGLAMSYPAIGINCVAPGWIQTAWGEQASSGYWHERAQHESLRSRWGTPDDVAAAIVWLASSENTFVNAQTIAINGGRRYYPQPAVSWVTP